jgi:endoglucanase
MTDLKTLLKELCQIPAPSGFERAAAEKIAELVGPLVDDAYIDAMGSVIGIRRCGIPGARRLLLDAHMDEIGFIVTELCEGFLKFAPLGKYDPRLLPAREVKVLADKTRYGVVASLPPHLLSDEEKEKAVDIKNLYIDLACPMRRQKSSFRPAPPAFSRENFLSCGTAASFPKRLTTGCARPSL